MKTHHALIAAPILLLLLGAITGREIFPKDQPVTSDQPTQLSERGKRKAVRVPRSEKSGPSGTVSPTDLQGLLDLVDPSSSFDPAAAFDWAVTISDDSTRYSAVQNTLNQWKSTDPDAARQAVAAANLTQEQRERLLRQLK